MTDSRPVPPVTIVDPAHPTTIPDEIGDDHTAWAPSRLQVAAVVIIALITVRTLMAVATARHSATEHRLDGAASGQVVLRLEEPTLTRAYARRRLALGIVNDGPQTVRVLSVRLDSPGYADQLVGIRLDASVTTFVPFDVTPACGPDGLPASPSQLLVTVQTLRQTVRTVGLPLPARFAINLRAAGKAHCGRPSGMTK